MASLHAFSPGYRPLSSVLPDHGSFDRGSGPTTRHAGANRPEFEANMSRAFHLLALRWLDDLIASHPKVTAICARNRITVPPLSPQGFAVTLSTEGGRCKVQLGPLWEEFGSIAEATDYMDAALHGDLRLRVDLSQRPHAWAVERQLPDGSWIDDAMLESGELAEPCSRANAWYFRNESGSEH